MKYNVGDKVRIVADMSGYASDTIGEVGVVASLTSGNERHPYCIENANGTLITVCCDEELELFVPSPIIEGILALLEKVAGKCGGYEIQRVREAATFVEQRHGTSEAIEYLRLVAKEDAAK